MPKKHLVVERKKEVVGSAALVLGGISSSAGEIFCLFSFEYVVVVVLFFYFVVLVFVR